MKKLLCLLACCSYLTGCMAGLGAPKTADEIIQKVKVTEDKFKNTKWVKFPPIRPNQMTDYKTVTGVSTANLPAGYFFVRALQKTNPIPNLVQVYFSTDNATSWGFYNSAIDSERNNLKFIKISQDITSSYGTVQTVEDFAINLNWEYLKSHRGQNIIIKVYGKKHDFVFFVPDYYVDGVLKYFEEENQ